MENFTMMNLHEVITLTNIIPNLTYLLITLTFGTLAYYALAPKEEGDIRIHSLGGISVITAWPFFTKRHDFLWSHFSRIQEPIFKFKVHQHTVIAVRGEEGRRVFFDSRSLDFKEGYRILLGGVPILSRNQINTDNVDVGWFNKQLKRILTRDRLIDMLPLLISDIDRHAQQWGTECTVDPFQDIYHLVFQLTVRLSTCAELADDSNAVKDIHHLLSVLEKNSTPQALLFPWFPSLSNIFKTRALVSLFFKLSSAINSRRRAKVSSPDAIDMLISDGFSTEYIVQFILGAIFGGVINTSSIACWSLIYVAMHPEWKAKTKAEVDALIAKHTAQSNPSEPLHKRLASIPMSAWENEMPVFDSIIRETIRLVITGTNLRRNIVEDIAMYGYTIKKGDFVAYNVGEAHLDPDIYRDPSTFDPTRFDPGREEDKKGNLSYVGWGAGRHPCLGIKAAKVELKAFVSYIVTGYDYMVVDKDGAPLESLPAPDRNDLHQARPAGEPFFIRFKRIST